MTYCLLFLSTVRREGYVAKWVFALFLSLLLDRKLHVARTNAIAEWAFLPSNRHKVCVLFLIYLTNYLLIDSLYFLLHNLMEIDHTKSYNMTLLRASTAGEARKWVPRDTCVAL